MGEAVKLNGPELWEIVFGETEGAEDVITDEQFTKIADVINEVFIAPKDAEIERLRAALTKAKEALEGEPEYHDQGMGCGLEDRGITDRYDAMSHGWEQAMERVYSENIAWAMAEIDGALGEKSDA